MSHLTFHRLSLFFFSRRRRGRDKDISGEPVAPKREESCNYRFSINNLVTSSISSALRADQEVDLETSACSPLPPPLKAGGEHRMQWQER